MDLTYHIRVFFPRSVVYPHLLQICLADLYKQYMIYPAVAFSLAFLGIKIHLRNMSAYPR
jgi:hypothetical protein